MGSGDTEAGATAPGEWKSGWPARWRDQFRAELIVAGFQRADTIHELERWEGQVRVSWDDLEDGARKHATHGIVIELPPSFPFRRPIVRPTGEQVIPGRGHTIREGGAAALCVWVDGQHGWRPWERAPGVLERVMQWFRHRHRGDWAPIDRPPDVHLYYPTSPEATFMLIGNDWPPPPEAREGRFALWRRNDEAMLAGAPTTSLTAAPSNTPPSRERISLTSSGSAIGGIGLWYRVPLAPIPSRQLSMLFAFLDIVRERARGGTVNELRAVLGDRVPPGQERIFFAIGYPDDVGEEHWVFLHANLSDHRRNWRTAAALEATTVYGMEAAPATREAILRRTGHTAAMLQGRRVAVFGAGALGGSIALWLAKAGMPTLDIIDSDRMRPGNVVRHVAGLSSIARLKTTGVLIEILDHVPDCDVHSHLETWNRTELHAIISQADVIVDATAVPAFGLLLNELCLEARRPLVAAAAFRRARLGRVRVTRPFLDACGLCYEGGYVPSDATYPTIPAGDEGEFVESGCGVSTVEATALDVDASANVAARAVLHLLRELHDGRLLRDAPNHALIVNEPVDAVDGVLAIPGIHWSRWPRLPGCEACQADTPTAAAS